MVLSPPQHWRSVAGTGSPSVPGSEFERIDPATGAAASRARACRAAEAEAAGHAAARAFAGWAATPPIVKRRILLAAADQVTRHAAAIGAAMRAEIGATDLWVRFNLDVARAHLSEAASLVTSVTGITSGPGDPLMLAFRDPVGVCLAIAPWNAPFVLGMRAVAMALACGNTVVLKASELCPATHLLIARVFDLAGLPDGVLSVVTHAPEHAAEVVEALIAHPAVRRVNFTGSTRVGRVIAETAARHFATESDLVLVAFHADRLGAALKWEPSRGGALFPHLYRLLILADVLWDKSLPLGATGHIFPEGVW